MFSLRAERFSCSLGILYGGLGISKLQFLIKKIEIKFPAINFFSILGHQTLDLGSGSGIRIWDPESGSAIRKNAGSGSVSGSALNQCGSETLPETFLNKIYLGSVNLVRIRIGVPNKDPKPPNPEYRYPVRNHTEPP